MTEPRVSIVVPSRNRPDLLRACIAGIETSLTERSIEVIVVDDGSEPPLHTEMLAGTRPVTILRREGIGPAGARNAGAGAARGEILLFTDDDAVPVPGWIDAVVDYLDAHPDEVGVVGPIHSRPWDPLYEQSLEAADGHRWTCNIALRREVFNAVGGFRAALFLHAHAEDRDLALRIERTGRIGFEPRMEVQHTPRRIATRDVVRQGRWARDDLTLYALHPQLTVGFRLPPRAALVVGAGRAWARCAWSNPSPRRLLRAAAFSVAGTAATAWAVWRAPSAALVRAQHGAE